MRLLHSVLLALFFVPSWSGDVRITLLDPALRITAVPVLPYRHDPRRRRIGSLVFERGYRLTGTGDAFGGYSSLLVEGDRFLLLNDFGLFASFTLDAAGRIGGLRNGALPDGPGTGWTKVDRDSESMTVDPVTRRLWVGFENSNEIWRYSDGFGRAERHAAPPAMQRWPINNGAEAMVRLRNGRFIAIAESDPWSGGRGRAAISFAGDPTVDPRRGFQFSYLPPPGYDVSDMAELPDGRLILLNRNVTLMTGFSVVVTIVDPRSIHPGARVPGRVIARFVGDTLRDNFEGIAVVREADGTKVWIVSDDNQTNLQQTLLLKFRLDDAASPRRQASGGDDHFLLHVALQPARLERQLVVGGLDQPVVEATDMLH